MPEPPLPRSERRAIGALLAAMAVLKAAYAFSYPFDSDEPQHLHVAWAWTQGLLPYRDVFDNHTPLFQALSAPLVALIGEDPRILVFMRLAMIPIVAAALAGSYLIGRRLFGARAAAWGAALCGLGPTFFFKSVEYRTDVLWAALWALGIGVLVAASPRARNGLGAGLLFGACLAVSLKSVMLFAAAALAALGLVLLRPKESLDAARRHPAYGAALAGGLVLPPAAIVLFFAARGALSPLLYCTVNHNLLSDVGRWGYSIRLYLLLPLLGLLLLAARYVMRFAPREPERAAFLFLLAGAQYILLSTVWPVHTRQDLLPFYPLFGPLLAGVLLMRPDRAPGTAGAPRVWTWSAPRAALVPGFLACLELAALPALTHLTARGTAPQVRGLREILALTDPRDEVMDMKGQAVFRTRPFYYALETMTLRRMERGLIQDTIPERCAETRTCVAQADVAGFPPRARTFLRDHYVVVGAWRVAGAVLDPDQDPAGDGLPFEVAIPARYALLSESGDRTASIDGRPYDAPRDLEPGRHVLLPSAGRGRLAVLWAQAAERGFSPFVPQGKTR